MHVRAGRGRRPFRASARHVGPRSGDAGQGGLTGRGRWRSSGNLSRGAPKRRQLGGHRSRPGNEVYIPAAVAVTTGSGRSPWLAAHPGDRFALVASGSAPRSSSGSTPMTCCRSTTFGSCKRRLDIDAQLGQLEQAARLPSLRSVRKGRRLVVHAQRNHRRGTARGRCAGARARQGRPNREEPGTALVRVMGSNWRSGIRFAWLELDREPDEGPRPDLAATHPGHWSGSWNTKIHGTITRDGNGWVAYLRLEDPPACHPSRPWAGSRPSRKHSRDRRGMGIPVTPRSVGSVSVCPEVVRVATPSERAGGTVPWFPRSPRGPLRAGRPAGLVPSPPAGRLASPSACGSGTAPRRDKPARIRVPPNGYPIAAGPGSQGIAFPTGSRAPALHGGPAHEA